ncbi:hypothetical protein JOF48_001006 [Arthrobacter stackebrandtii]|uniref:DUF4272 domain-containing protein n=1 Tax=Arthrobacter stackebrandtii TaxID=272161 RepID=A0ABS4YTT8_9MICC|nr:hypothetical protein [Arthrobacter stackebrandtii]MBP2412207.1 hypothetical protein [Arthrobacter stackebrandtii]PYH01993.1 hypothetical protein CVV67_00685 [Arthrobacter stackebrandtii]
MAKKSKNTKKSRFGNPAKAAADAAAKTEARSAADARLDRAMTALSSGFVDWLEAQSRPDTSIDVSLAILDDFFDMYRIIEPHADPTNLVPEAVYEVMDVTADANPLGVLTLRSGVNDYVSYLAQASLWTGTPEDLAAVRAELVRTDAPETLDGAHLTDADGPDGGDFEFADIFIPELSPEDLVAAAQHSPLWLNTLALLDWVGDGRELGPDGKITDQEQAAAVISHSGFKRFTNAQNNNTAGQHGADRLAFYWEMLAANSIITVADNKICVADGAPQQDDTDDIAHTMSNLLGYYVFSVILADAVDDDLEDWQNAMAGWLSSAASATPPAAAVLLHALEEPEEDPAAYYTAEYIARWAEEGLVTLDEHLLVPPAWRADVYDILHDDFPIQAVGPGAEAGQ